MFSRLFLHYPHHDATDPKMAKLMVANYIESTKAIPAYWLSVAMYAITQTAAKWRPGPGEIGTLAIRMYRREHLAKEGKPEFGPHNSGSAINLPLWTHRAREASGMPKLKAPEPEGLPPEIDRAIENMGRKLGGEKR